MFAPIHLHTHASLLDGAQSTKDVIDFCVKNEYPACGMTNHGNLFDAYSFNVNAQKQGIKPIIGIELYLSGESATIKTPDNRKLSHLCVLSRNYDGWKKLVQINNFANQPSHFYYKPRLSLDELSDFITDDLVAYSGHAGSDLANACITSLNAYRAETIAEARNYLTNINDVIKLAEKYKSIFTNFFIEIQLIDEENIPVARLIADMLREVSKRTGIPCVATGDSHYTTKNDAHIQRILLCSALRTTLKTVYNKIANEEEFGLGGFFKSNNYHIPTLLEMEAKHTKAEIQNTIEIANMCENYSLQRKPQLPKLYANDNQTLTEKCRHSTRMNSSYEDRLNKELEVIHRNNLSGYFLMMEDIVRWAEHNKILVGAARGSSAGCLISYLLDITKIDPLKYGLLFERFYNDGRNTKEKVSLPDIDVDFDRARRGDVINYIKDKYGHDKVAHIMTISTLKGRGAVKEVLRVYNACSQMEMNEITRNIPQEAEISDHLETMRQEKGYSSIIEWTLENEPDAIKQWVQLDGDTITGEYAKYFELAIKIEGAKKNIGQHASGIIVSNEPLEENIPLVNQGGELIGGMEMGDLENMGVPKLDILGISTLSRINSTLSLIGQNHVYR